MIKKQYDKCFGKEKRRMWDFFMLLTNGTLPIGFQAALVCYEEWVRSFVLNPPVGSYQLLD